MNRPSCVTVEPLRTPAQLEAVRAFWDANCGHRDADFDFFAMLARVRPGASPYVLRLDRQGETEALCVGRIEPLRVAGRSGGRGSPRRPCGRYY